MHTHLHTYTHTCTHAHMHAYIHTYIHTHQGLKCAWTVMDGVQACTYFQGWTPSCHLLGQHSLDAVHAASMQQTNSYDVYNRIAFVKQNQRNDTPIMYSAYVSLSLSLSGLFVLSLKPLSLSESISLWSRMYILNLTFCLCLSVCFFSLWCLSCL